MQIHKAKKSLGQNFLKSNLVIKKIVEAGEISPDDIILEIGPGKGALTEKLLEKSNCIIAIEKDKNLFQFLQEKFAKEITEKKLILLEEDILNLDISSNFSSLRPSRITGWDPREAQNRKGYPDFDYKIIANIPYNITGAIFKKFLTEKNQPEMMILMVQHEVAKRIVARNGKESILSISIKAYGEPKLITKVPSRYFSPEPAVDSAVIAIKNISRRTFIENNANEDFFWEVVRAGFAHKRKKLSSNLKNLIKNSNYIDENLIKTLGNKRAEELSLIDWINISKNINIHKK